MMKRVHGVIIAAALSLSGTAVAKLASDGPAFLYTCRIVDEAGAPITNAVVHARLAPAYRIDEIRFVGKDLGGGYHELKGTALAGVSCTVTADGYYDTRAKMPRRRDAGGLSKPTRWLPYGQTNVVVLKKMISPRPLVHRSWSPESREISTTDWVGYDCFVGDLCQPHGSGRVADFLVRPVPASGARADDCSYELSFTNHPHAGFYVAQQDVWSDLKGVRAADTHATYRAGGLYPEKSTLSSIDDRQIVFRTRTKVDSEGRLVSAHYGKIEGYFGFRAKRLEFGNLIFNPVPNDPNLEHRRRAEDAKRAELRQYGGFTGIAVPPREDVARLLTLTNAVTVLDEDGCALAGGRSLCHLTLPGDGQAKIWAFADGYYLSGGQTVMDDKESLRRWQDNQKTYHWKPVGSPTVQLRSVRNPQWMISGIPPSYQKPEVAGWRGFDFERMDWCPPWGEGRVADLLVRWSRAEGPTEKACLDTMEISFTNSPYAGFYRRPRLAGPVFDSDYLAETNAVFCPAVTFVRHEGVGADAAGSGLDESSYWVFRTRTKVDAAGRLISAHYGKIYGPVRPSKFGATFGSIVFNPVPNDPNLEDVGAYRASESAIRKILTALP